MMPLPNRPLSAAVIRVGGEVILFDCGENTQVNWRVSNFSFRACGTILLSHLHADHVAGLPGLLFQIAFSERKERVTIIGPPRTVEIVKALLTIVGRLPFELQIIEIEEQVELPISGGMTLHTFPLNHRIPSIGYRLDLPRQPRFLPERARELGVPVSDWGRLQSGESVGGVEPEQVTGGPRRGLRLSLIGDTSEVDGLGEFVADSDLLICESTYLDDALQGEAEARGHMTLRQAAMIAREAPVRTAWFTHFSPRVECARSYQGQATKLFSGGHIGYPGLKTTLSFDEED